MHFKFDWRSIHGFTDSGAVCVSFRSVCITNEHLTILSKPMKYGLLEVSILKGIRLSDSIAEEEINISES